MSNKPAISPIRYISENRTPQAQKFVVSFGKTPAVSGADLQMKMAAIVKQFGDDAKKELAKIHPDTDWIMKAMTSSAKMEGGGEGEFVNVHGKGCKCPKCMSMEKHSNFITNYRSDAEISAGDSLRDTNAADGGEPTVVEKGFGTGAILLAILAVGILVIASGERSVSHH